MGHFHIALWNAYFLILLGIAIVVLDLFTVLFLTPIGVALIVWGILDIFGAPMIVSGLVAILTLIVGYYLYVKFAQTVKQGQDFGSFSLIGKEGVVKELSDDGSFIVEVDFDMWVAIPAKGYEDKQWHVGDKVVVEAIDGVKLIVKPKEE
jgi:membrane protein implicated in regulation of membrane protease activity